MEFEKIIISILYVMGYGLAHLIKLIVEWHDGKRYGAWVYAFMLIWPVFPVFALLIHFYIRTNGQNRKP
jgi:hypothetical protein